MNVVNLSVKNAAIGVGVADQPEGLGTIHADGCAAVIWRRQAERAFQDWMDGLDPGHLPHGRSIIRPAMAEELVTFHCEAAGMPDGAMRDRLVEDVAALTDIFAHVTGAPFIRMRLERVETNACKKFHIDAVTTRLICTYRGTGTQYGISTVPGQDPGRVFTVPTGAPIILRGMDYPHGPKSGLLHRSPPIEGTGETRFVLVLDPIQDQAGTK